MELCRVRRTEPYATKFLFPVCSASASEALEDLPVALPSPRGPGPEPGGTQGPQKELRCGSSASVLGLRPIEKGLRRKADTRHTGFPRSQRGSVAGHRGDCHSPAFLPRVAAAGWVWVCGLLAGSGPTETSRIREGPTAQMGHKRRGLEHGHSSKVG